MDVTLQEDRFVLSAYTLKDPVRYHVKYENSNASDLYDWLGPLLYMDTDFAAHIPESEWPLYAGGEWDKERFASKRRRLQGVVAAIESDDKYSREYVQVDKVVLCKGKGVGVFLCVYTRCMSEQGLPTGLSSSTVLMKKGGVWKFNVPDGRDGISMFNQVSECRRKVFDAVDSGDLKSRDIKWMK
jgi:hypothetical protein